MSQKDEMQNINTKSITSLKKYCDKNNKYIIIHKGNLCGFGGNNARTRKNNS